MRVKNNINQGIISGSNTKFSKLTSQELPKHSKESYQWDLGVKIRISVPLDILGIYQH